MTEEQFPDLIARGCAKVNISTALKIAFIGATTTWTHPAEYDPPTLFATQRAAVKDMAEGHIRMFGRRTRAVQRADGGKAVMPRSSSTATASSPTRSATGIGRPSTRRFAEFGLPVEWSEEEYGRKLQIAGGKERMASELTPEFVRANGLPEDAGRTARADSRSGTSARPRSTPSMVAPASCRRGRASRA